MYAASILAKELAGQGYRVDIAASMVFAPTPPVIQAEEKVPSNSLRAARSPAQVPTADRGSDGIQPFFRPS